nr:IS30 family transposase [uncultured Dysosmobacter sp.]
MKRITWIDRLYIEKHQNTLAKSQLAKDLGCCLKTIYNEFSRGGYWHTDEYAIDRWRYSADIAQQDYEYKQTAKGCPVKLGTRWDFIQFIESQIIDQKVSPYTALQRWKQKSNWTISLTTLYRYIDSGLYFPRLTNKHLPEKSIRQKRQYDHVRAARSPKGTSIERRPAEINARTTWGHWEMDTVIGKAKGKGQAALVLTERLTRFELIFKLKDKTTKSVVSTLSRLARRCDFPNIFKSITVDNGSEFQDCKGMERLNTKVYYCHPYTSCERGSNERMNRMIRRFFPKGSDFSKLKQRDCDNVAAYLNNYQRRSLGGQTPLELWLKYTTLPPL